MLIACKDPETQLDQLTSTGPYAGTVGAFTTGTKLQSRYPDLVSKIHSDPKRLKVWASDSNRVKESARLVSLGMFGGNYSIDMQVIAEGYETGGNTLTPTSACPKYDQDNVAGHDLGTHMMAIWEVIYIRAIADRIEDQLYDDRKKHEATGEPLIVLSADEVFSMQEMCAFEINVRGQSPWCDVFTKEEWTKFEFARDIYHFYRSGPGNSYAKPMGGLWLNATAQILISKDAKVQADPFFFSFTHDTSIVPILVTLGIYDNQPRLHADHFTEVRQFTMSHVLPMGGRTILEKMSCGPERSYVRLNVNDGIMEIPGCSEGPGSSCPLDKFAQLVEERVSKAGSFKTDCNLPDDVPEYIDFLKQ
jgi:acid phosphatase